MTESIDEVLNALDATINGKAVDDKVRVALQRYAAAGHCTFNVSQMRPSSIVVCD